MDKKISQPLNEAFNIHFEETYKEFCLDLKSLLFEPKGKKLSVLLGQYKSNLYEKIQLFSAKRISSNGLMPDVYTEYLIQEYKYRMSEYEEPIIDYFISEHLAAIKEKFHGKELAIPENIQLDEIQTVELIAKWQAAKYLFEKLLNISDSNTLDEILEKIRFDYFDEQEEIEDIEEEATSDEPKGKGLSMKQQTIIISYMLNALGSRFVDKTAKAKFVQKLTEKSYDNIYDVVRDPLRYKNYLLFKKDMDIVRDEFLKLDLQELAEKVLEDSRNN